MLRGLLTAATVFVAAPQVRAAEPDFTRDVAPLLRAKCHACHGAVRQKSGLRLDAGQLVLKGGKNGPVVVPGKPDESPLVAAVTSKDKAHPLMPPEGEGEALNEKEVALFRDWVAAGAKAPVEPVPEGPKSHWAYQPLKRPPVPQSATGNPIDAFLGAERAKHKVTTSPEANKATLLRRVYLDLVGVPPTAEQLAAFLKDDSPDAYEKVVDRLLASPMYGERWGRHWMDVWRYSDPFGSGDEFRYSQRHVWKWRDWIVESLNADKGYDRMVTEMLAGDELAPGDPNTLRATGYLARNWYKFNRTAWIQDTVEYTAAGFLGITMRCARCHDHKYDPVSQQDYYRFRAVFEPHDVRIDPVPGQPDVNKDGVARAYDKTPDAPTYLYVRGDERTPDKSRTFGPDVPSVFANKLAVSEIKFGEKDFAALLPVSAAEARKLAKVDLDAAEANAKRARAAVLAAKKRLEAVAAGAKPKELAPFLRDTFTKKDDALWKVLSGQWVWEGGKLVCKTASTFATVGTKKEHPAALVGRVRYKTTGGGLGSVGFSYDFSGSDFQAVYLNAVKDCAVRPFHRVNGADTYPEEGIVPFPVKLNEEVTLDFAVRGNLLNVWANGKLTSVYKLPVARKAGEFAIWTHDATAEFYEVTLTELPDSVALAARRGEDRPSPLAAPLVLTKTDAEKLLKRAEAAEAPATARVETARAAIAAVEARFAADAARFAEPRDDAKAKSLALAAGKAERQVAALRAAEAVSTADATKLDAAKKAHADAVATVAKDDPTYAPLVKAPAGGSTGRRLALAKWIASAENPLTARVAVNHIWMRHFGTPLVASVANFGLSGKKPTHPELLDWLAYELANPDRKVGGGAGGGEARPWGMKHLHRLIVTSRAYRLSSRNADGPNKTADPENRLYWRANSRRMDAEVVRDSLLAVAGQLDTTLGGPIIDEKLGLTSKRRSLYFRFNAEYKMSFLDQFDAASPTECYERRESVVPQQALALHNSALALNTSRELAKRLAKANGDTAFVTAAFERVLCRAPAADERGRCERFLRDAAELYAKPEKLTPFPAGPTVTPPSNDPKQRAREDLVHVLLNHNDFVTVR